MDPQVTAAIIAGAFVIVSPITTYIATKAYAHRDIKRILGRRKAIVGDWKGTIKQMLYGEPVIVSIEMTFTAGKKIIEGNCLFKSPLTDRTVNLKFTGGFYHARFIKFDYQNINEGVIQFGSTIIDLHPDSETMTGKYVGYGSNTDGIINGDVVLKRI